MTQTYPKTKSDRMNRVYYLTTTNFTGGPTGTQQVLESKTSIVSTDSVFLGASPRGWKHNLAIGAQAGSSLSGSRFRLKPRTGSTFGVYLPTGPSNVPPKTTHTSGSAVPGVFPSPATSVSTVADDKARQRVLGDYIKARTNWRGGNFLAEIRDVIHTLRHPYTTLFSSTVELTKKVSKIRRLGYSKEYRKRLGDIWLTYSFGIKPLFEDFKDYNSAVDALNRSPRFDGIPISGSGSAESAVCDFFTTGFGQTPGGGYRFSRSTVTKSSCKYYGVIGARQDNLSKVQESFGLTTDDFIPAVWEAIPWSFLVDYFVNFNEVLDSMRYASADLRWMMKGFKNEIIVINGAGTLIPPDPTLWAVSGGVGGGELRATYKSRVPSGLPYPRFHFKIPGLGSLKWANIGALVAGINGSKPSKS